MISYIMRRLLLMIPTLFLASLIVFFFVRFIPGDVIDQMTSDYSLTPEQYTALKEKMGLNAPIHIQYGRWMGGIILRGDIGTSFWSGRPVTEDIFSRIPITVELGLLSLIIGQTIALPIGAWSALRQDSWSDYAGRSFAIINLSIPHFWMGTMIMIFPAIWWGWSPPITLIPFNEDPIGNLRMFLIPAIVLGMHMSGTSMRMMRTMMLEVLRQDYIRTAWAKGLRERAVVTRHALKNAMIPVITVIGLLVSALVGSQVIIEKIFCLPGLGLLLVNATEHRDYPVVTGTMLFFGVAILVLNLIVDLTYAYLDPRVRLG
ncbi:ABC transporter permease [Chloroflexota bacterium]